MKKSHGLSFRYSTQADWVLFEFRGNSQTKTVILTWKLPATGNSIMPKEEKCTCASIRKAKLMEHKLMKRWSNSRCNRDQQRGVNKHNSEWGGKGGGLLKDNSVWKRDLPSPIKRINRLWANWFLKTRPLDACSVFPAWYRAKRIRAEPTVSVD